MWRFAFKKNLHQVYKLPQEVVNNRKVWLVSEDMRLIPRKVENRPAGGHAFSGSERPGTMGKDWMTTLPEYPQADMVVKTAGHRGALRMDKPATRADAYFTHNSVAANLLMVFILVLGIASYFTIQRQMFPNFELNYIQIEAVYPGASPQEIVRASRSRSRKC